MMKLKAALMFAHLNLRKEKAGEDDGPNAADVKLTGDIGYKEAKHLFSTKSAFESILVPLYQKSGELITGDVASIKLAGEAKNIKAGLTIEGGKSVEFEGASLNKITLKPKAGHLVELSARLQVHPTAEQLAVLADLLGSTVILDASGRQIELHLEDDEGEEEEEQGELEVAE